MVGDITYINTAEGWLYLATVIDCYSKKVIGWATADHYRTPLIEAAIDAAVGTISVQPEAVFHSDRGSNYTSYDYAKKLESLNIRQSVGATGICWDNAMAESFFGALKNEWLHHYEFATRDQARKAILYYIEGFYNNRRLHSSLGYRTPQEAENEHYRLTKAA